MTSEQVLSQLKKLGQAKTAETYARHGVSGACYGVSYADLKPFVKKIGKNQGMALKLWKSGVHDARIAATMIAEPQKMTPRTLRSGWMIAETTSSRMRSPALPPACPTR
jgi:3-methyladenine DNA glycosylase AlkD